MTTTTFEMAEMNSAVNFVIHPAQGNFNGRLKEGAYCFEVQQTSNTPKNIHFNGKKLKNQSAFENQSPVGMWTITW